MDSIRIGKRLRYFRERAGISQLELETEINSSSGVISRIEKGKTNPTKETLNRIIKALDLSPIEVNYLVGKFSNPVTEDEIKAAVEEVKEYFSNKSVLAYLICDRQRVWAVSQGFYEIFSPFIPDPRKVLDLVIGATIPMIMLNPDLGFMQFLQTEKYTNILKFNVARFHQELSFVQDDPVIASTIAYIKRHPIAKEIWEELERNGYRDIHLNSLEARQVPFRIFGKNIILNYSREPLVSNRRFDTLEYVPDERLFRVTNGS